MPDSNALQSNLTVANPSHGEDPCRSSAGGSPQTLRDRHAVVFLVAEESAYITRQTIYAKGGLYLAG